jgi:hypothetical protein
MNMTREMYNKFWLARDLDGELYLYPNKPTKEGDFFYSYMSSFHLDATEYPEVTFENSPQEVELKLTQLT